MQDLLLIHHSLESLYLDLTQLDLFLRVYQFASSDEQTKHQGSEKKKNE